MSPGTSCAAHTRRPIATAGKTRTTQLSATPQVNTRNGIRRRSATRIAGKSCPRRIVFVRCQSIPRQVPGCVRVLPNRTLGWCEVALDSENALPRFIFARCPPQRRRGEGEAPAEPASALGSPSRNVSEEHARSRASFVLGTTPFYL